MVVVASKYGQLGNRLFLFGHLIAAAAEHGFRVWNPAFGEYADLFASTAGDPLCRYPSARRRLGRGSGVVRRALYHATNRTASGSLALGLSGRGHRVVRVPAGEEFDLGTPWFVDAARRMPVLIQGWLFRDERSFAKHADLVRSQFGPIEVHGRRVESLLAGVRTPDRLLVGVHVRRGDYRRYEGGRFLYDDAAYRRLLVATQAIMPAQEIRFLVCSDEPIDAAAFAGLDVARGTGHLLEDMYALAGCDYLIGPPSTYTAWASFYGRVPLFVARQSEVQPQPEDFSVVSG
jgi:hypothetical protein